MTDRKPVTPADLDREELLQLVRDIALVRETDLIWAQWQVLTSRARKLGMEAIALCTPISDGIIARSAAHDAYVAAMMAYKPVAVVARAKKALREAEIAVEGIEAKQKRLFARERSLGRRADRLLARHKELRG
jgi:hypothetical protein